MKLLKNIAVILIVLGFVSCSYYLDHLRFVW